jgi:VWFA-related protein
MRRTILLAVLLAALPLSSQQPVHTEPPVYVTAIDMIADVRDASGKLPDGLTPADFVLVEDGVERKVVGVDYLRAERQAATAPTAASGPSTVAAPAPRLWQTVLYFESQMSSSSGRQRVAAELAGQAETLAQMGTVDVIFANPTPAPLVRNTRDPEAIRTALKAVSSHSGINQLVAHRRRYLRERNEIASIADIKRNSPKGTKIEMQEMGGRAQARVDMDEGGEIVTGDTGAKTVRPYIDEEIQLINRFRTNLLGWVSNYRRHVPRTLVVVTDGFDLDPLEFYSANLNQGDEMALRTHVSQQALAKSANAMAGALAASGWTALSVPADISFDDGWQNDASTGAIGRVHGSATKPRAGDKGQKAFLYRPIDPLNVLAVETGGAVVPNSAKLGEAIQNIDDRVRITYQVDRKPDGKAHKVEIRPRNKDLRVKAAQWASTSTPDEMAEVRALGLMSGGAFAGDLPVKSSVAWSAAPGRRKGMLEASADVRSAKALLAPGARGDFRLTLAIKVPEKGVFVTNHIISGYKLDEGVFRVKTPVDFPEGTSDIVVVIEEINTSLWGSGKVGG